MNSSLRPPAWLGYDGACAVRAVHELILKTHDYDKYPDLFFLGFEAFVMFLST